LNLNYTIGKKEEEEMKKLFAVLMMVLFLAGCGAAARESGFYEHNTMYADWNHLKFSIAGYKNADQKAAQQSKADDWWGKTIEVAK
jgi:hypothetical protein